MIGQIGPDTGTVVYHRDVVLAQVIRGPDPGQHEQLRAADGPGSQDHLGLGPGCLTLAAEEVMDTYGAPALTPRSRVTFRLPMAPAARMTSDSARAVSLTPRSR